MDYPFILRQILLSQLRIERVRLDEISRWNQHNMHTKEAWNMCSAIITEIEKQLKEL